ncbi:MULTISPECIES: glycosyltransferase family 2 protein [unclassified Candidatus Frackibacter]|uniref:glycosyltransferase family 2 protein n=1 Tax=unclassified Candidatus Frackibacter TaxID=2648818 RepID=UPI0007911CF9|nr:MULTISPECIES: glycosyltransferase family 2 protein [unclassified Candidatus Frackibacter]KXS41804.1 MAG: family 2 glycosyl transferase [Candidatus Frackibacter sp. T328-2]SDC55242.1 Glycosyltransferase, GT2 family [Candidatus Frackibacter sp. WG11]SEM67305.1 Glycosyltransferase, GT2 family [Candidatus Frackibacter sp. WG12]SFL78591.1 Glycosyltransferase, GT2 family [Candidatus Frackibacter sp. WG13]
MLVSIVIPTHNNWDLTQACLNSIKVNTKVNYEIIVVDNCSTDGTRSNLKAFSKVRAIHNDHNMNFAKASNQGTRQAKGKFVLFLNNDTIATEGWLNKLLKVITSQDKIGVVGSKLLFPDSNLIQHAGIVLHNGKPGHIYYKKPASLAQANLRQEYPAVTGACMLMLRRRFLKLGGFDERFINGYEDVDLCLRVWEAGFRVVYCPKSIVYHYGSSTEGRHEYEEENLNYFLKKWGVKLLKFNN